GIYDTIRRIFAAQPLAKKLGLAASAFSFNVPGGRCEACKGLGKVEEDLSFLGDVEVRCRSCQGQRFREEVLAVTVRGYNLMRILGLTIAQAAEVFSDQAQIVERCHQIIAMGLGYLTLGQDTRSFSGGEA